MAKKAIDIIEWGTDENGIETEKFQIRTPEELERWENIYNLINALDKRIKDLESK